MRQCTWYLVIELTLPVRLPIISLSLCKHAETMIALVQYDTIKHFECRTALHLCLGHTIITNFIVMLYNRTQMHQFDYSSNEIVTLEVIRYLEFNVQQRIDQIFHLWSKCFIGKCTAGLSIMHICVCSL